MYESVLEHGESMKLQRFLDGSEPGVLYLYGLGGNGKTTLMRQIQSERPSLFEKNKDHYQVVVHEDNPTGIVSNLFKNIVMTNVLPVDVNTERVVHFKKTFSR